MKLVVLLVMLFSVTNIFAERCKAHIIDLDDNIIDTFSVWTPHYNRSCQLAMQDCERILKDRIFNGERELRSATCIARWRNSDNGDYTVPRLNNTCHVSYTDLERNVELKKYTSTYRGRYGFLSWMTACNQAMTTCLNENRLTDKRDCLREEYPGDDL